MNKIATVWYYPDLFEYGIRIYRAVFRFQWMPKISIRVFQTGYIKPEVVWVSDEKPTPAELRRAKEIEDSLVQSDPCPTCGVRKWSRKESVDSA